MSVHICDKEYQEKQTKYPIQSGHLRSRTGMTVCTIFKKKKKKTQKKNRSLFSLSANYTDGHGRNGQRVAFLNKRQVDLKTGNP